MKKHALKISALLAAAAMLACSCGEKLDNELSESDISPAASESTEAPTDAPETPAEDTGESDNENRIKGKFTSGTVYIGGYNSAYKAQ